MATRTDKPWGHELLWSHTNHYAGKIIHINAGHRGLMLRINSADLRKALDITDVNVAV